MSPATFTDHRQQVIQAGDIVRIIKLSREFINSFPADERILFESMIGQFFKVVDLDEEGYPCVVREWHDEHGQLQTHMLALDSDEIEKV